MRVLLVEDEQRLAENMVAALRESGLAGIVLKLRWRNNSTRACIPETQPDCRERIAQLRMGHCPGFSPQGTCAVRFQAGIRRMQCDQKPGIRP
jgi:hypothetical protein